jgi:murein DD-endopeptidase MepM/ murein hydrolase activator NlpD
VRKSPSASSRPAIDGMFPTRREALAREAADRAAALPVRSSRCVARTTASTAGVSASSIRVSATAPRIPAPSDGAFVPVVSTSVPTTRVSSPSAGSLRHRMLQRFASAGAMAGVALIVVSTTVPANAFTRAEPAAATVSSASSQPASAAAGDTQQLRVEAIASPALARDAYSSLAIVQQVQVESGNQVYSFSNDPNGTVQWPFPGGSPIASGFGPRQVAGCGFCSTNHQGLDFTPGSGTEIQAVAAGVVTLVENSGSGLGSHVEVDHIINGQKVQSVYGHMQLGSIKVAIGDEVGAGQVLGLVGSTGASTGAHLHLEIHLDGTPVDPFAWLQANAN